MFGGFMFFSSGLFYSFYNDDNWNDLRFPVSAIRLAGASPPTTQAYRGGEVLSFASNIDQYVYVTAQMPHSRKNDSDIIYHIHWTIPVGGTGGVNPENVKWDITYSWANTGATFPIQSTDTVTTDVRNIAANTHIYSEWTPANGTGKEISSMIIISIKRDTTVANNYGSAALMLEFDIHYMQDKFGSISEWP